MENENIPQPLDTLMTKLGLVNADLVKASTEQLSFKMVQKARKGHRLSPNVQDKILSALLSAKPDLKLRRRELFHYEPSQDVIEQIKNAMAQIAAKKIEYPQFVDLLVQAGINHYAVDVAANRVTFYGSGGGAHVEQGPVISQGAPGNFNEEALRSAIADAQKELIDHPTFLKRIYDAGINHYEVNLRNREIRYKGDEQSYKELIPSHTPGQEPAREAVLLKKVQKPKIIAKTPKPKPEKIELSKKNKKIARGKRKSWKPIKKHRVKFKKRR